MWARPPIPKGDIQLYFIAIGSDAYLYDQDAVSKGLLNQKNKLQTLYNSIDSARRVAALLADNGARYGILLLSSRAGELKNVVTRSDMRRAIDDLKARIRADRAPNPRIIFYYMGHGLGDRANGYVYIPGGDLAFTPQFNQVHTIKLIKNMLWSYDLITALVTFRTHPSMAYLDGFYPSDAMPDITEPGSTAAALRRAAELERADEANRAAGRYPPEGNPPVPFAVLLDNCFDRIDQDLVPASDLQGFFVEQRKEIEEDGLVLYAARPGSRMFAVPETPSGSNVQELGPLALRMIRALRDRDSAKDLSFGEFIVLMKRSLPMKVPIPYGLDATKDEVLRTTLVPARMSKPVGRTVIEERAGTGRERQICCP